VVAWINAEDREEMLAGYAQLAAGRGLAADGPDSAEAARRVRHWLEVGGEHCLLVLDNVNSADVLRPFLPAAGHAQVIITSSKASLAGLGAGVPVDVFTDSQATAFLAERTGLDDQSGALAVAQELGCLPLALAQAGAVIAGQRLDYPTYLTRLAAVTLDDYLTRPEADPYPRGTAETITLALDAAALRDDAGGLARRLLGALALLSPAGAPRALVAQAADASAEAADAALGRLADWSLVTFSVDGSAVSAHRLIMRVVRERSAADGSLATSAGEVIRALQAMLPAEEDAWRHPVLMQEFVTQVTALSGHLDTRPGLLGGQAEEEFLELLVWAGWYLDKISDLSRAIPLLERALTDCQRVLGPDHPGVLSTRNYLAVAYQSAGRLDEAIALHEQVLADRQRVLGTEHPDTVSTRHNLAYVYESAGRLDEAIALFEQVLADFQRVLGSDHLHILATRNNLALAYKSAGRLDEAIALFEQVLADAEQVLGPDHPNTLATRDNLAASYQFAGRLDEAIALFEQVLADRQRVLGTDHPGTLTTRHNLAYAYEFAGRLDEAIALFEQVLADRQVVLNPDHPSTLSTRHGLAAAYRSAGRLDEAIALFEQVLADEQRVLGGDHPSTLITHHNLAGAFQAAGRVDEAIALYGQVLADHQRVLGSDHPGTLASRHNLAGAYQAAGRVDEAIALFRQVLADRLRVLGANHPDSLATRNSLAGAFQAAGRVDEAIGMFEQVLADAERVLGAGHPIAQTIRKNLDAARVGDGSVGGSAR
jgi:tetratricopeptide (TPR) repeat protein